MSDSSAKYSFGRRFDRSSQEEIPDFPRRANLPKLAYAEVQNRVLIDGSKGIDIPVCQLRLSYKWTNTSSVIPNAKLELIFISNFEMSIHQHKDSSKDLEGVVELVLWTSDFPDGWDCVDAFVSLDKERKAVKGCYDSRLGVIFDFGDTGNVKIEGPYWKELPENYLRYRRCADSKPSNNEDHRAWNRVEIEPYFGRIVDSGLAKLRNSSQMAYSYRQNSWLENHQSIGSPSSFKTAASNISVSSRYSTPLTMPGSLWTNLTAVPNSPKTLLPPQLHYIHRSRNPSRLPDHVEDILPSRDSGKDLNSDYMRVLREKNLFLGLTEELNWSGKGQHVEFPSSQTVPLEPLVAIGHGGSALVDSVICRRVKLARKTMTLSRRQKLETVMCEVEHLQRLQHAHIVQLVGSYTLGRKFAILLYPVAEFNLSTFLASITSDPNNLEAPQASLLPNFQRCLSCVLEYVHENDTKHMDIKPQNILVRRINGTRKWRVYLADFGISKHFANDQMSQTDNATPRSKIYCSPEVYLCESKGRSSDVFSMGCVFLEMETVLASKTIDDFVDFRSALRDDDDPLAETFHDNLCWVEGWIEHLEDVTRKRKLSAANIERMIALETISSMLAEDQAKRPVMSKVVQLLGGPRECCLAEREKYEAAEMRDGRYV